jgi:tetratricopeptide (TPR) repeat protein
LLVSLLGVVLAGCAEKEDPIAEARALHAAGKYSASLEPLRTLLSENPNEPEFNFLYGSALRQTGSPDMAIWALRKAAESPEWRFRAGLELGAAALAGQEWENALSVAGDLLEESPDEPEALLIRAQALMGKKAEPEQALADFERIIALEPQNVMAHTSRAAALISLGRVEEAAQAMAELGEIASEAGIGEAMRGTICVTQALFASERGEQEESEQLFAKCAEEFPRHPTVVEEYAGYYDARGERDRATEILRDALEARPNSGSMRMVLSRRLIATGDFDASEALLREGIALDNPRAKGDAWVALADHYVALGDLPAAADAFEKSLEFVKEPTPFQTLTFADVLARSGQHDRALEVARGLENDTYRGLIESRVYYDRGEPARALERLDEILPFWPNNPGARYYAARSAEQLGNFPRAIEEYRQAIRSAPAFTEAGLRLGLIFEAAGDATSAWAAVSPYAEVNPADQDAAALQVRLASRYGPDQRLKSVMKRLLARPLRGRAIAERTEFIAQVAGPEAAIEAIREIEALDLSKRQNSDALRTLLRLLARTKQLDSAFALVDAAVEADPEAAIFHVARGELAALAGRESDAKQAFARAVELDPNQADAHLGLGRLARDAGAVDEAIAHFDAAARSDVGLSAAYHDAAELLLSEGRGGEAEERWEALLRERPYHVKAATSLVKQRLARGELDDRTLELASRAVAFRGGEPAIRLLAEVQEARGETDQAKATLARLKKKTPKS